MKKIFVLIALLGCLKMKANNLPPVFCLNAQLSFLNNPALLYSNRGFNSPGRLRPNTFTSFEAGVLRTYGEWVNTSHKLSYHPNLAYYSEFPVKGPGLNANLSNYTAYCRYNILLSSRDVLSAGIHFQRENPYSSPNTNYGNLSLAYTRKLSQLDFKMGITYKYTWMEAEKFGWRQFNQFHDLRSNNFDLGLAVMYKPLHLEAGFAVNNLFNQTFETRPNPYEYIELRNERIYNFNLRHARDFKKLRLISHVQILGNSGDYNKRIAWNEQLLYKRYHLGINTLYISQVKSGFLAGPSASVNFGHFKLTGSMYLTDGSRKFSRAIYTYGLSYAIPAAIQTCRRSNF